MAVYQVRYADGLVVEVPVVYGRDLRNWWKFQSDLPDTEATVAWEGTNETASEWGVSLRLYHAIWENPHPDKEIASVTMERVNPSIVAPFCVAITAESAASSK